MIEIRVYYLRYNFKDKIRIRAFVHIMVRIFIRVRVQYLRLGFRN